MDKRERVIKGLEHCTGNDCNGDKWSECEYSGHGCIDTLIKDALDLLKAQEAAKPIENAGFYYCGACKYAFTSARQKYCSDCGRAVKWE